MQKISTYLYSNIINVIADLAIFPVRWNIVYQNNIKIYKGVDNLLTIDVKNADQKRIDISSYNLKLVIFDVNGQEVITTSIIPSTTTGLATTLITSEDIVDIGSQFLKYSIYNLNSDNRKNVFYADANFGAVGNIELVGSAVPVDPPPKYITRFTALTKDNVTPFETVYYSDAVEIIKPNFLHPVANDALAFEFETTMLQAEVTIEFTKDSIVSAGTEWESIETFTIPINSSTNNRLYAYPTVTRDYTWARVKYTKQSTSGKINKVTVTFEKIDQAFIDGGDILTSPDLTVNGGWSTT